MISSIITRMNVPKRNIGISIIQYTRYYISRNVLIKYYKLICRRYHMSLLDGRLDNQLKHIAQQNNKYTVTLEDKVIIFSDHIETK